MTAPSQEIVIEPSVFASRPPLRGLDAGLGLGDACGDDRGGVRRFWDERFGVWSIAVLPGEIYVTEEDEHITTVLGSCVSACVRHPGTRAGGLNHLLLPSGGRGELSCEGLRSLDALVLRVLAFGGRADELEVKMFGGGRVIAAGSDIGRGNVAAVRAYFAAHAIAIAIADVGGGVARRLRYEPRTGRVLIRRMVMRESLGPELP